MTKKEANEIRKQFIDEHCSIKRICGCYVNGEKEIQATFKEAFLSLDEEERFKYFEILKKTLSGTSGKNLIDLAFPLDAEMENGSQKALMELRACELNDDELLNTFYNHVIETFDYIGNYLILLIYDSYDVPGRTLDGIDMDDASEEVYNYILCSICPVNLDKPGLSFNADRLTFENKERAWVVDNPEIGFLFPSFNDRTTDIHSTLFYTKNPEKLHTIFIDYMLGCARPLTAKTQKETFQSLMEETLGSECDYAVIRNIHDNLNEMIEDNKSMAEPLILNKPEVKKLLTNSGVSDEKIQVFEEKFQKQTEEAGAPPALLATNIASTKTFQIKTPDVIVQVNPDRSDLVETKIIDGRKCLVIEINDTVSVNGINVI